MNRQERRRFEREHGFPPPAEPPAPAEGGLQVGPVPVTTTVALGELGSETRVLLHCATPVGLSVYFLDANNAQALAAHLAQHAAAAATGLTIVGDVGGGEAPQLEVAG